MRGSTVSKVLPKITKPGSSKFPTKGPHNPNVGTHGSGIAPRNASAGQRTDKLSMPAQGGIARVKNASNAPSAGSFLPVQKPKAGLQNQPIGQQVPSASAVATRKPNRKGGAAFYGEI